MPKKYREGPIGALMDEYERATKELQKLLKKIDTETYVRIMDTQTKDKDCQSIETIMNHVVRAGFGYANYIRKQFGEDFIERKTYYNVATPQLAIAELNSVLKYSEETLSNKWKISWRKIRANIIHTNWKQDFDMDQLLEHAIVHILRHRRQIEKLLC
jgi:uncharacterized damage-inducible protein DinB